MSDLLTDIQQLVRKGQVNISDHGYDELAADGLFVRDIISSIKEAKIVEEYPDYPKGPCILVLQKDQRKPICTRSVGNPEREVISSGHCYRIST